jgi:hypothetical protein
MNRALVMTLLMLALTGCGSASEAARQPAPAQGTAATVPAAPVPPPPPIPEEDAIVCPADVKLCPDGSYVARDPAKRCEFHPCPGER